MTAAEPREVHPQLLPPEPSKHCPPGGIGSSDRKMSPEKRALFERIAALRRKIGPIKFNIVAALREMRES